MKDWKELTDEELASLTEEQIEIYKKLIYAEEGIKFPVKPKEIEISDTPKDTIVYSIKNITSDWANGILFTSFEEATAVAELLSKCKSLGHRKIDNSEKYFELGRPKDYNGNPTDFVVSSEWIYSKNTFIKNKQVLLSKQRLLEQYNADMKEYEDNLRKANEVTKEFEDKLENARKIMSHREYLYDVFYNDYMPLADQDTALKFLKKAYTVSDEDELYIINRLNNVNKDETKLEEHKEC